MYAGCDLPLYEPSDLLILPLAAAAGQQLLYQLLLLVFDQLFLLLLQPPDLLPQCPTAPLQIVVIADNPLGGTNKLTRRGGLNFQVLFLTQQNCRVLVHLLPTKSCQQKKFVKTSQIRYVLCLQDKIV